MGEISKDMIKASYSYASRVYNEIMHENEVLEILESDFSMNRNTAKMYIKNFRLMMDGINSGPTMSASATEYYLNAISEEFGADRLKNALRSLKGHVENYKKSPLEDIRKIIRVYEHKLETMEIGIFPDEIDTEKGIFEGAKKSVTVNIYERDPKARKLCIEAFGLNCRVCQFDFEKIYGNIGKGFIHVHHLNPIHKIGKEYKLDPVKDLRPVCPNCHAMLHKRNPPYSIEELQKIIANHNSDSRSAK